MDDGLMIFAVARKLPILRRSDGTHPDNSTMFRWWQKGSRGVRLRAERIGGRVYTRLEWVEDFIRQLNADNPAQPQTKQRDRQIRAAQTRLAAAGI